MGLSSRAFLAPAVFGRHAQFSGWAAIPLFFLCIMQRPLHELGALTPLRLDAFALVGPAYAHVRAQTISVQCKAPMSSTISLTHTIQPPATQPPKHHHHHFCALSPTHHASRSRPLLRGVGTSAAKVSLFDLQREWGAAPRAKLVWHFENKQANTSRKLHSGRLACYRGSQLPRSWTTPCLLAHLTPSTSHTSLLSSFHRPPATLHPTPPTPPTSWRLLHGRPWQQ